MTLWKGRFSIVADELMRRFGDSIGFDRRLYSVDIRASVAYAGALAQAFLRAVWAEERDISDPGTIAAILAENGHDAAALAQAGDAAEAQYDANTALALERGVFGAPFYIVGDERFWGQDRLEFLDRHLAAVAHGPT